MKLSWYQHVEGWVYADSAVWHDEGSTLQYTVECEYDDKWIAQFEGHTLHRGNLADCLGSCQHEEDVALERTTEERTD